MAAKKRLSSPRAKKKSSPTRKKAPAKKAPAKKAPAKKAPAKKAPAKKAPAKKAPAKKAPAKKVPAKKAPAKKVPAKRSTVSRAPVAGAGSRMPSARAQPLAARRAATLRRETPPRVPSTTSAAGSEGELPGIDLLGLGRGDERRRFQRVPKELKVRLFAGASQGGYLEARLESVDMSLSGIFLRSTFFLPEGTPVRVELDGAWGQTAEAKGTVARVQRDGDNTGFGIHFEALDTETLRDLVGIFVGDRIERFVQTFSRQRGKGVDQEVLWEGILAWELERLQRSMPTT
jgi:hypothetical protein